MPPPSRLRPLPALHHRPSHHPGAGGAVGLLRRYLALLPTQLWQPGGGAAGGRRPTGTFFQGGKGRGGGEEAGEKGNALGACWAAKGPSQPRVLQAPYLPLLLPPVSCPASALASLSAGLLSVQVVGFVPTGWLYEMKRETFSGEAHAWLAACLIPHSCQGLWGLCMHTPPPSHALPPAVRRKGACSVHLVPYSEHSSYEELLQYVRFLRPHQVGEASLAPVNLAAQPAARHGSRSSAHSFCCLGQ